MQPWMIENIQNLYIKAQWVRSKENSLILMPSQPSSGPNHTRTLYAHDDGQTHFRITEKCVTPHSIFFVIQHSDQLLRLLQDGSSAISTLHT